MDKKFLLKPGEKLTISINRKSKVISSAAPRIAEPSKGIIKSRRHNDYPKRRLSSDYVNFYDLGQIKDAQGNWKNLSFFATNGVVGIGDDEVINPFLKKDWDALKDLIFQIPFNEWKDKYRKLDYETADELGISVYFGQTVSNAFYDRLHPENPLWTEKGLKISPGRLAFTSTAILGYNLLYQDVAEKVTETLDYNAEEVSLPNLKDADIFLMPSINYRKGKADTGAVTGELRDFFGLYSRELFRPIKYANFQSGGFVDYPVFYFSQFYPFTSTNPLDVHIYPNEQYGNFLTDGFRDRMNGDFAKSPFSSYRVRPSGTDTGGGDYHPVAEFPPGPFSQGIYTFTDYPSYVEIPDGVLSLIIKTPSKTYYVWTRNYQTSSRNNWEFQYYRGYT